MSRDITESQRFCTQPDIGTREVGEVVRGRKTAPRGAKRTNLNSAVGARKYPVKLLMLIQKLCLEISTMANPFGEAL